MLYTASCTWWKSIFKRTIDTLRTLQRGCNREKVVCTPTWQVTCRRLAIYRQVSSTSDGGAAQLRKTHFTATTTMEAHNHLTTYQGRVVFGQLVNVVVIGPPVVIVVFFTQHGRVVFDDLGLFAWHAVRFAFGLPFGGHDADTYGKTTSSERGYVERVSGWLVVTSYGALSSAAAVVASDDKSRSNEKCGGGAKTRMACTKHCKHNATGEKIGSNGGGCDDSNGGRH